MLSKRWSRAVRVGLAAGVFFALAITSGNGVAQVSGGGDDLPGLEREATQLANEQQELLSRLKQNLSEKHAHQQQLAQLDQEISNLKAENDQLDAQRPSVAGLCQRTVPREQLSAAEAQCESVLDPYNNRINAWNSKRTEYLQQQAAVIASEQTRVAEARQLLNRYKEVDKRLAFLRKRIDLIRNANLSCSQKCKDAAAGETASQCLQHCWDNARSPDGLPLIPSLGR